MGLGIQGGGFSKGTGGNARISSPGKNDPIDQPFDLKNVEEVGPSRSGVGAAGLEKTEAPVESKQVDGQKKVDLPDVVKGPAKWSMSKDDMFNQLLKLKMPPTRENQEKLMSLLEHGIPASLENFETLNKLMKGKKDSYTLQSSILTMAKGLGDSSKSVSVLSSFLANVAAFPQLENQAQFSLSQLQQVLSQAQKLLGDGLQSGLITVLADMDDAFKTLKKKSQSGGLTIDSRAGLADDFKTLLGFLGGLEKKLEKQPTDDPLLKPLLSAIRAAKEDSYSYLSSLTSQAILSKNNPNMMESQEFMYWQIRNPFLVADRPMDLLIRKEGKNNKRLDPEKTSVVLNFETASLGALSIVLEVNDSKVWTTFHTDKIENEPLIHSFKADFKDRLAALNYELVGVKVTQKKLNIKQMLTPTYDLNHFSRINTEI